MTDAQLAAWCEEEARLNRMTVATAIMHPAAYNRTIDECQSLEARAEPYELIAARLREKGERP